PGACRGLVLAAHGARDGRTVEAAYAQAVLIGRRLASAPVEIGFLEFIRPTITEAVARMASRGVDEAVVVPLFLAAGAHVQRDLPAIVRETAAGHHSSLRLSATPHVGSRPALQTIPAGAIDWLGGSPVRPGRSGLLVLAHGSRLRSARSETHRLAARLATCTGAAVSACGFLVKGEPRADAALRQAAGWPVDRLIVHGHFLFPGRMIDMVGQLVEAMRSAHGDKHWAVTGPLGPGENVTSAVMELFNRAIPSPPGPERGCC
ncbi:MAG: sirohydrochlorin chelatase, partial [Pirellulales bacterium]